MDDKQSRNNKEFSLYLKDEKSQSIKVLVWIAEEWEDEFVTWDPTKYDGMKEITVPHSVIWTPDTYLYSK